MTASDHFELHVLMDARMVVVRSVRMDRHRRPVAGSLRISGSNVVDAVDDVDHIGAGLALHVEDQRLRAVHPAAQLGVLGACDQRRDVLQANRRAVAVGDDDVAVFVRAADLIVGVDRVGAGRPIERALGAVLVGDVDGRAQIVEIEAVGGQARAD